MGFLAYAVVVGAIYAFIRYDLSISKVIDYVTKGIRLLIAQQFKRRSEQVSCQRDDSDTHRATQMSPRPDQHHEENSIQSKSNTVTPMHRRTSRHGFDGDFTGESLSPLTPATVFSSRSSTSKHGFYDADDWEYKNTSFGTAGYVPRSRERGNLLFPASPAMQKGGHCHDVDHDNVEDVLSPLSQESSRVWRRIAARRLRQCDFEDLLSPQSGVEKENDNTPVSEHVTELLHKQASLASDLAKRDKMRESNLQQVAGKRRILLESNLETQRALMREYEAEESRVSVERAAKAEEVQAALSDSRPPIDIGRLSALLEDARCATLPLQPAHVAQLETLVVACGVVVDEAQRLSSLVDGNDMAEKETFEELARVLARNEAVQLLQGKNPVIARAAALLEAYNKQQLAEEAALAEEKNRLERESHTPTAT